MSQEQLHIPQPPSFLFSKEKRENLLNEKNIIYLLEKQEAHEGKGILNFYKNVPYPKKGFPTPEALYAINQVKRDILITSRFLKNSFFILWLLTTNKNDLLKSFNESFDKKFGRHKLKEEFLCPTAFNFANFVHSVLLDLKIEHDIAKEFAFNIAQILEYDDAYRYRFQDVMTELNVESFKKNPKEELLRLYEILASRSTDGVAWYKIKPILNPFLFISYFPKVKKSLIKNVQFLKQCERDTADWYWCCLRDDNYFYGGLNVEERHKQFTERPEAYEIMA